MIGDPGLPDNSDPASEAPTIDHGGDVHRIGPLLPPATAEDLVVSSVWPDEVDPARPCRVCWSTSGCRKDMWTRTVACLHIDNDLGRRVFDPASGRTYHVYDLDKFEWFPHPDLAVDLFLRYFLNRTDILCFDAPWHDPCPIVPTNVRDVLRAHVAVVPRLAPEVGCYAKDRGVFRTCAGHFRIGSYFPGPDGFTRCMALDFDGGSKHKKPLADPTGAARTALEICRKLGIPAYLEKSKSTRGWHLWVFFSSPIPAAKARRLGHLLVPRDLMLKGGKPADVRRAEGVEVFPKSDTVDEGGVGMQVFLPWWRLCNYGGCQFHRQASDGTLRPYIPRDFETVSSDLVDRVLAESEAATESAPARTKTTKAPSRPPKPAGSTGWTRFSKRMPCPICGREKSCSFSHETGLYFCLDRRCDVPGFRFLKEVGDDWGLFAAEGDYGRPPEIVSDETESDPAPDYEGLSRQFHSDAVKEGRLPHLAGELGVAVDKLVALRAGDAVIEEKVTVKTLSPDGAALRTRTSTRKQSVWTFPERGPAGPACGITRRFRDGKKRSWPGGLRGLTYSDDWLEHCRRTGALLLVEGATCTAAALTMDLAAIGRPSNAGGEVELALLLAELPEDVEILVAGENDFDPVTGRWRGKEGAVKTTERLARSLRRPIVWTLPPAPLKDTRAWLLAQDVDPEDKRAAHAAGRRYLAELRARAVEYVPPEVNDERKGKAWAEAFAAGPGLYADSAPPPEPAKAAGHALDHGKIRRSLTVVATNKIATKAAKRIEESGRLIPRGEVIGVYPVRTPDTCKNLHEVREAEGYGLSAGMAVCPDCIHHPKSKAGGDCRFQRLLAAVKEADHRVATAHRASGNLAGLAEGAEAVFILDEGVSVMAPHVGADLDGAALDRLLRAATVAGKSARRSGKSGYFWDVLGDLARDVLAAYTAKTPRPIALPAGAPEPSRWAVSLLSGFRSLLPPVPFDPEFPFAAGDRGPPVAMPRNLVGLLTAAAAGRLRSLDLEVIAGELRLHGVFKPSLPPEAAVIVLESSAEAVARATEREVKDISGGAPPAWSSAAVQVCRRVTGQTRATTLAKVIRGYLAAFPGERLAVLLPSPVTWKGVKKPLTPKERKRLRHSRRRQVRKLLTRDERKRVALVNWRSQRTLTRFDRVLALGLPTLPPRSLMRWLLQTGRRAEALEPPDWGEFTWTGHAIDGDPVPVVARGYRHPAWHAAHVETARDTLRRRLAGVTRPVILHTDVPLGLPLVKGAAPLTREDGQLLGVLRRQWDGLSDSFGRIFEYADVFNIDDILTKLSLSTPFLSDATGLRPRTAQRRLQLLQKAGLAHRVGERGGWYVEPPPPYPSISTHFDSYPAAEVTVGTAASAKPCVKTDCADDAACRVLTASDAGHGTDVACEPDLVIVCGWSAALGTPLPVAGALLVAEPAVAYRRLQEHIEKRSAGRPLPDEVQAALGRLRERYKECA